MLGDPCLHKDFANQQNYSYLNKSCRHPEGDNLKPKSPTSMLAAKSETLSQQASRRKSEMQTMITPRASEV